MKKHGSIRIPYDKIEVVDFLEELGISKVRDEGTEVFYSCPFSGHSNGDSTPSASMKQGSTVAYCFSCGWKGNALTFLAEVEGIDVLTAAKWIRQRFGDDFQEPQGSFLDEVDTILAGTRKREDIVDNEIDEYECFRREVDWPFAEECLEKGEYLTVPLPLQYMLERGFNADILLLYKVGFDAISQRITLPYRLPNGKLVGFKGRAYLEDQQPRYWMLGGPEYGFESFNVSKLLFGLNLALESNSYKIRNHLIVREGELNAISMAQRGYENTVGVSGKFLSDTQLEIIKAVSSSATVWFDSVEDTQKIAAKIQPFMPVYMIGETSSDPAEMSDERLKQAMETATTPLLFSLATK